MMKTFRELVALVVSRNGDGHKEVYRMRDAGEISEEEAQLILFAAQVEMLNKRVSTFVSNVEALSV